VEDLVSVVIPAYRAEPFIRRTVGSALAQTRPDFEVVIASDDGVDYARLLRDSGLDDPRVRCVSTGGIGTGVAHARNTALDAARGRVIATLDADDLLEPTALEVLVPLALQHGAAYPRARFVDYATGEELESFDRSTPSGPVKLEEILTSQIHTFAGITFDRSRVTARWPAWMDRWEDVYFYVRCFDDLESIHHVAEPLYIYHRVPGSICNRPEAGHEFLAWADELATRIEQGDSLDLANPGSRKIFRRFLRSRHAIEAAFTRALAEGACTDFHSFTRLRLDLFYDLDARDGSNASDGSYIP
jgi:glycosyltransferase involved in cell wall biosynthesis